MFSVRGYAVLTCWEAHEKPPKPLDGVLKLKGAKGLTDDLQCHNKVSQGKLEASLPMWDFATICLRTNKQTIIPLLPLIRKNVVLVFGFLSSQ